MKKLMLLTTACILAGGMNAQNTEDDFQQVTLSEENMRQLSPTFLENVHTDEGWAANWFVYASGGMSAFIGTPVGHGDFFDRTKPFLNAGIGKWFSPAVGGRLAFNGLSFTDSDMKNRKFQSVQAHFLYNLSSHFRQDNDMLPRWDAVPYLGCGIIHNAYNGHKPFAMSGGFLCQYRISERLHLTAELGYTTTFGNFDGKGKMNVFDDRLLTASAGLSVTLGKNGWNRVIDPKPYITQNDILIEYLSYMKEDNDRLKNMHDKDAMALTEMRKILEIEGLLDKYVITQVDGNDTKASRPKNNYSGLNSLRARLRNKSWNGDVENYKPLMTEDGELVADSTNMSSDKYFQVMKDGRIFVGAPIYFFFKLGTDELTEKAQIINIKEVAGVIKKYGLSARVIGAADSQTGTAYANERLSEKRADYITRQLEENGVSKKHINKQYRGGINSYEPLTGNRNTCVMLFFKNEQ